MGLAAQVQLVDGTGDFQGGEKPRIACGAFVQKHVFYGFINVLGLVGVVQVIGRNGKRKLPRAVTGGQRPTAIEQFAYSDTWQDGTASYLGMLMPRLTLARELLSNSGSIFIHIDWHVGHYLKVIADEVFGKENFINEIIWQAAVGDTSAKNKKFIKSHDTILFYRKTDSFIWNDVFQEYSETSINLYKFHDEKGKYRLAPIDNPGGGGYFYDLGFGEKAPRLRTH